MIKKLLLGFVAFVALLVGVNYLLLSPEFEYNVEHDMTAKPAEVVAVISDLRTWDDWSPWNHEEDPDCKFTYVGEPGAGMVWNWTDGKTLGAGTLKVTRSDETGIDYHMEMIKPMAMVLECGVTVTAKGEGTHAVWWSKGESDLPGIGRIMNKVFAGQVIANYEKALEGLDAHAIAARKGTPMEEAAD